MKKLLLALGLTTALSLSFVGTNAFASPNNTILTKKEEVKQFQKANGLVPDGVVGKKTKAEMMKRNVQYKPTSKTMQKQPIKVAAQNNPFVRCQFIFWEYQCSKEEQAQQLTAQANIDSSRELDTVKTSTAATKIESSFPVPPKNIPHIEKAKTMIGMSARGNRQQLASNFQRTLGQRVDPVTIPWCAAWANMVLADVGMETTGSLMARSFLDWGEPTYNPKHGDVVVMRRGRNRYAGHVGFFYGFVMDHNGIKKVAVLGGNQGKQVKISYYPISKVIAYRTAA